MRWTWHVVGSTLLVAALVVGALVPDMVTPGPAGATEDLARTRAELDQEARTLEELRTSLRRTSDEVAALDVQLAEETTVLAGLEEELDAARTTLAQARARADAARADVATVDAELDASLADWSTGRDRLAARAVHAFKHGAVLHREVLVRGVTGADDWHEVTVTMETVSRLVADDRARVDVDASQIRETAELRAETDELRATAATAEREADAEADRVGALVERAATTIERVAATRAERRAVLDSLEGDVTARAVLVQDLEDRVARLELAATRVLIPIQVDLDPFGPAPTWAAGLPGDGARWGAAIDAIARRNGIDPRLLAALVWTESNFRADAVSHAGALGLAQLMPDTARGLRVDPRDPLANLDGGARYLRGQLETFGRVDLALAAYNAGPSRVRRAGGIPDIVETQLYVTRVIERFERLGA
ncbi:MAG: transglycosylase SLT domain-containing protein [Nitriliruptoraceae bacterium]